MTFGHYVPWTSFVTGNSTSPLGLPEHVRHEPCRTISLRTADEMQLMVRLSAAKMHALQVGVAEDWALDDSVNQLFPTSKHADYDWNDEPIENSLWRLARMLCTGHLPFVAVLTTGKFKHEKPKTKNGNDTGFVSVKTDQQNIVQQGVPDRLVDVESVDWKVHDWSFEKYARNGDTRLDNDHGKPSHLRNTGPLVLALWWLDSWKFCVVPVIQLWGWQVCELWRYEFWIPSENLNGLGQQELLAPNGAEEKKVVSLEMKPILCSELWNNAWIRVTTQRCNNLPNFWVLRCFPKLTADWLNKRISQLKHKQKFGKDTAMRSTPLADGGLGSALLTHQLLVPDLLIKHVTPIERLPSLVQSMKWIIGHRLDERVRVGTSPPWTILNATTMSFRLMLAINWLCWDYRTLSPAHSNFIGNTKFDMLIGIALLTRTRCGPLQESLKETASVLGMPHDSGSQFRQRPLSRSAKPLRVHWRSHLDGPWCQLTHSNGRTMANLVCSCWPEGAHRKNQYGATTPARQGHLKTISEDHVKDYVDVLGITMSSTKNRKPTAKEANRQKEAGHVILWTGLLPIPREAKHSTIRAVAMAKASYGWVSRKPTRVRLNHDKDPGTPIRF